MDDQWDGNYLWEKIGHSQEIVIKYKKLINRLKEAGESYGTVHAV